VEFTVCVVVRGLFLLVFLFSQGFTVVFFIMYLI
jgi:hypothetical protein